MHKKVKLTPSQERVMEIARVGAMTAAPFYSYYFNDQMEEYPTDDVPTAATDGRRFFYNPAYFETLTPDETVFATVHEIDHAVMLHAQRMRHYHQAQKMRSLPWDSDFFNVCADYIINARLVRDSVGRINQAWLFDPSVKGDELVEDLYEARWRKPPPGGGGGGGSTAGQTRPRGSDGTDRTSRNRPDKAAQSNGGRFDEVEQPQRDPETGRDDVPTEAQFADAIARAAEAAKQQGKLPAHIRRLVDELVAPQVNWREYVRMLLTGKLGARKETWLRPNRRRLILNPIVFMPGKTGYGSQLVVVGLDTSGSISQEELTAFCSEVGGVLNDCRPRQILVVWCDAEVRRADYVRTLDELEGIRADPPAGGGGTSFVPVFDYVKEHGLRPDSLIYLTDMYGAFPEEEPAYPVVWCKTTDKKAPFGDEVRIVL